MSDANEYFDININSHLPPIVVLHPCPPLLLSRHGIQFALPVIILLLGVRTLILMLLKLRPATQHILNGIYGLSHLLDGRSGSHPIIFTEGKRSYLHVLLDPGKLPLCVVQSRPGKDILMVV